MAAKHLKMPTVYRETLDEYMLSYNEQTAKIERSDKRIEELASQTKDMRKVKKTELLFGESRPVQHCISDRRNRRF